MKDPNPFQITNDYTDSILQQCNMIEKHLISGGMDVDFSRLISIQATYNTLKQLVGGLSDIETQEKILKVIEFDAKNLVFPVAPNVDFIGHA